MILVHSVHNQFTDNMQRWNGYETRLIPIQAAEQSQTFSQKEYGSLCWWDQDLLTP